MRVCRMQPNESDFGLVVLVIDAGIQKHCTRIWMPTERDRLLISFVDKIGASIVFSIKRFSDILDCATEFLSAQLKVIGALIAVLPYCFKILIVPGEMCIAS